jgi:hypothetical protein
MSLADSTNSDTKNDWSALLPSDRLTRDQPLINKERRPLVHRLPAVD